MTPETVEETTEGGLPIRDLLAVLEPVIDWYQSDEHPKREPLDILRDIVADLQSDRSEALAGAADKRRLDWLESHPFMAYRQRDPRNGRMYDHFTLVDEDFGASRVGIVKSTLRDCIDEALHSPANSSVIDSDVEKQINRLIE